MKNGKKPKPVFVEFIVKDNKVIKVIPHTKWYYAKAAMYELWLYFFAIATSFIIALLITYALVSVIKSEAPQFIFGGLRG